MGLATLEQIQTLAPADRPVVVMISGHGNIETAVKATKLGAFDFIEKPLTIEKVSLALKMRSRSAAWSWNSTAFGRMRWFPKYRQERPHQSAAPAIETDGGTNGRVLIYGESGTGKELVAHAIHRSSQRAKVLLLK